MRPEQAILGLRTALGTFANLRPARMQPALVHLSPLKAEIVQGADVLFVRELVAGTYFARPKKYWQDVRGMWRAVDTCAYTEPQVERTVRMAFELARGRRKRLHVADKQNVMATSRLWRDVATRVAREYADVEFLAILTDALAMHLLYRPTPVRRDRHRQSVRRSAHRRSRRAGWLNGFDAQRVAGRGPQPSWRLPRAVRADPWDRARHRGPRHRQPDRRDPEPGAAAALLAAAGARGARGRNRYRRCDRARHPNPRYRPHRRSHRFDLGSRRSDRRGRCSANSRRPERPAPP